jgi:hypothetical protein
MNNVSGRNISQHRRRHRKAEEEKMKKMSKAGVKMAGGEEGENMVESGEEGVGGESWRIEMAKWRKASLIEEMAGGEARLASK